VHIFIAEKFSFSLSLDLALQHGLKKEDVIDAEFLTLLLREDGDAEATAWALTNSLDVPKPFATCTEIC